MSDAKKDSLRAEPRQVVECEALLVATGRKPNVEGIGLEKAGVEFTPRDGVKVNDHLQTTNKVPRGSRPGTRTTVTSARSV